MIRKINPFVMLLVGNHNGFKSTSSGISTERKRNPGKSDARTGDLPDNILRPFWRQEK